mgnify:CR=1 FL=1
MLPYLSRTLSIEGFGLVAWGLSICVLGFIITDFGFGISGVEKIAKNKNDKIFINSYLGAVFASKLLLLVFTFIVLALYTLTEPDILHGSSYYFIVIISFVIFSQTFQPIWFYQGIEEMKSITIYTVTTKLLYLVSVFILVAESDDAWLVLLLYGISNLIGTLIAVYKIYTAGYRVSKPTPTLILDTISHSVEFFISRAAVGLYTGISVFLLGAFSGLQQVAIYSAAEKLYQGGQSISAPISQAMYPYVARTGDTKLLYKFILIALLPLLIGVSFCIFYSESIIVFIFGNEFSEGADILKVFLVCSVINFIGVNLGYPAFSSINKISFANKSVILGGTGHLICLLYLYWNDSLTALNIVFCVLLTEIVVLSLRLCGLYYYTYIKKCKNG